MTSNSYRYDNHERLDYTCLFHVLPFKPDKYDFSPPQRPDDMLIIALGIVVEIILSVFEIACRLSILKEVICLTTEASMLLGQRQENLQDQRKASATQNICLPSLNQFIRKIAH